MAKKRKNPPEDSDPGLLAELLLWVFDNFEKSNRNNLFSAKAKKIIKEIENRYLKFESRERLRQLLPSDARREADSNKSKRYVYFMPVDEGGPIIPIMTFGYNLSRSSPPIPEVRFRVGLFLMDSTQDLKSIGFRFEAPEGEGIHHYYHAQMITGFSKGDASLNSLNWLPESQPAFSLDAKNSVELFICLLVSLYGLEIIDRLQSAIFFRGLRSI